MNIKSGDKLVLDLETRCIFFEDKNDIRYRRVFRDTDDKHYPNLSHSIPFFFHDLAEIVCAIAGLEKEYRYDDRLKRMMYIMKKRRGYEDCAK